MISETCDSIDWVTYSIKLPDLKKMVGVAEDKDGSIIATVKIEPCDAKEGK